MNNGFGMDPVPGTSSGTNVQELTQQTACLHVLNGPGQGRTFPLQAMRLLVGRNDPPSVIVEVDLTECELCDKRMVSRRHAEIQWVNGALQLTDIGSLNGTMVNGAKLELKTDRQPSDPVVLKIGDRVMFADIEMEVATVG